MAQKLDGQLQKYLRRTGESSRIDPLPRPGADVPDDLEAMLVVLFAEHPF